jgi:hypothetical protein
VTVPLTVSEEEPLAPAVKVNPVVDARVNVPCETESVNESAFGPASFNTAAASVIEMALPLAVEKLSELFSFRLPVRGALALGGEFAPKPARLGTVVVTPGVTAGVMGLVTCPWTPTGGVAGAEVPKTVADKSCRDSKVSTPRPPQNACWTDQAPRRFRRIAADLPRGLRESDSHLRKNILVRINILVALRCTQFDRETSKGGPMVPV